MKDYHFDYIVKNEDGQIVEQDNILHRGSSEEDAKQKALSFLEDVYTEKYYDEFTPTIEMAKDSYAGGGNVWIETIDLYKKGELKDSDGNIVTDKDEAYKIAYNADRKSNPAKYAYAEGGVIKIFSKPVNGFASSKTIPQGDWRAWERAKQVIEQQIQWNEFDRVTIDGKEVSFPREFEDMKEKFYMESFAGGGGVRVLKSEGRYRIYGEIHGNKPFLIEATDDRSSLKELTKGAKEWIRGAVGDSRVFVVDTKEDREIFENQYAKGGGIKKRMYGGRACQCRCCPTCNEGWGINTQW